MKFEEALNLELINLGFKKSSDLIYYRENSPQCSEKLTFPNRYDKNKGLFFFNCFVGVGYTELERLLRPFEFERGEKIATVVMPIHFLREGREYWEWSFSEEYEVDAVVDACVVDIKKYAFPFLDKYSDISCIEKSLRSENPKDWFVLGPERRVTTLAAIVYAKGNKDEAIEILNKGLEERKTRLPKHRRPLEELLERIL